MNQYFQVIYEDNHLIAVNKEAGVLVQPDKSENLSLEELVKEYIAQKYNKQGNVFLGVIHRIDQRVSGLVVLAKTSKALERMNELFRERQIEKTYWALTDNRPPEDAEVLTHWLLKDGSKNITRAYNKPGKGAKEAVLSYRLAGQVNFYLLEVKPETGRPHQIRAQLGKIGCPLLGDLKYGSKERTQSNRIYLHSRQLDFVHPVKKEPISLRAPLPNDDIWRNFAQIRADRSW